MTRKKNSREGSTFESFLKEAGILEEVNARAMKKVIAWQLAEMMRKQKVTKATMAKRMKTSRAALQSRTCWKICSTATRRNMTGRSTIRW